MAATVRTCAPRASFGAIVYHEDTKNTEITKLFYQKDFVSFVLSVTS
jgi:hypothetical protein